MDAINRWIEFPGGFLRGGMRPLKRIEFIGWPSVYRKWLFHCAEKLGGVGCHASRAFNSLFESVSFCFVRWEAWQGKYSFCPPQGCCFREVEKRARLWSHFWSSFFVCSFHTGAHRLTSPKLNGSDSKPFAQLIFFFFQKLSYLLA
ncbi:hypothetical protein CEXT_234511 [Caerostris extrusa]|uniref:Uncharacterized protein n=1 Tax=Caerostris extrusa TaxID=172846 RepID=A0AAV4MYV8_CAEEX|nr:hypothetical protein CEXT_234511 [Caerostris extrusa]